MEREKGGREREKRKINSKENTKREN